MFKSVKEAPKFFLGFYFSWLIISFFIYPKSIINHILGTTILMFGIWEVLDQLNSWDIKRIEKKTEKKEIINILHKK